VELKLPIILASRQDITHVHRELRLFTDTIMQSIMRHDNPVKYPAISANLRALAVENQIDLRDQEACQKLLADLEKLKDEALCVKK
jgi:predicted secreted Zn-dependent protease